MKAKDLKEGLYRLREKLLNEGYIIETERWQGGTDHPAFLEILHADMVCPMSDTAEEANDLSGSTDIQTTSTNNKVEPRKKQQRK